MTDGTRPGVREEYVKVLEDYSYQRHDRTINISKDESLMVIKRANNDWWQVIRKGDSRAFFAPAQYLKPVAVPSEEMKQCLKQRQSQNNNEIVPIARPSKLAFQSQDSKSILSSSDARHSPSSPFASQSYMTKIETNRVAIERTDPHPLNRPGGISSFKSESLHVPMKVPPRNGSNESVSHSTYSLGSAPQVGLESSSSHTSKSSLNDGSRCSTESLSHSYHKKHHVVKAASHDELSSGDRCHSSLDVSQPRAASSEGLDGSYSSRDFLLSNRLSYRHRSNSVDLRIIQKELSFAELKQSSLEKGRKPRITKDRRRSWAVEERQIQENHRSAYYKKGDTEDSSIILSVPPKLPPKQRKNKPSDILCSTSENSGKLEGPIDIKIQEVKCNKPPPPLTTPNIKRLSLDYDKGNARHDLDNINISDNRRRGIVDSQDAKDFPIALPRKNFPPQLSSLDNMKFQLSQSKTDTITKDDNGNQVMRKNPDVYSSFNASESGSFRRINYDEGDERKKDKKKSDSFKFSPRTPDLLRKMERAPDAHWENFLSQEALRSRGSSDPSLKVISRGNEEEDRNKEREMEDKFPPRETPTPDLSRAGKMAYQFPPSPKSNPHRIVFDEWGEFYDESTKRQFYYNSKTREKRWKPPRKGIHSVSIPEVPSFVGGDRLDHSGEIHPHPRSPPPDYPASLETYQFVINHSEGASSSMSSRSCTLGSSTSHFPRNNPEASSHTLPASISNSPHKSNHPHWGQAISLLSSPPAPPASAKPHVPATPTSPDSPEVPELSEAEQNSALLDVLDNLSPPKGWTKKYDAYTQRVFFYNGVTKERWLPTTTEEGKIYFYEESGLKSQWKLPEESVWISKEHVLILEKKYMLKFYQSMMEVHIDGKSKFDYELPEEVHREKIKDKADCEDLLVNRKGVGAIEHLAKNTIVSCSDSGEHVAFQNVAVGSPEKSIPLGNNLPLEEIVEARSPPEKPPRKTPLSPRTLSGITDSNLVLISLPMSPVSEGVSIDTPSVMTAGSRLSSFAPRSSVKVKGHSRSKSETIKMDNSKDILTNPVFDKRDDSVSKAQVESLSRSKGIDLLVVDKALPSSSRHTSSKSNSIMKSSAKSTPSSRVTNKPTERHRLKTRTKETFKSHLPENPISQSGSNNSIPGIDKCKKSASPVVSKKHSPLHETKACRSDLSVAKRSSLQQKRGKLEVDKNAILEAGKTSPLLDKKMGRNESDKKLHSPVRETKSCRPDPSVTRRSPLQQKRGKLEVDNRAISETGKTSPLLDKKMGRNASDKNLPESDVSILIEDRRSPVPFEPYKKMLRELSFHSVMKLKPVAKGSSSDNLSSPPFALEKSKSYAGKPLDEGLCDDAVKDMKELTLEKRNRRDQEKFNYSSNLQIPSVCISPSNEIPTPKKTFESQKGVRNSTFFAHEEDSIILEDKPLHFKRNSSNYCTDIQGNNDVSLVLREDEPISPAASSTDSYAETPTDWNGPTCSFYVEEFLPEGSDNAVDGKDTLSRPLSPESLRIGENLNDLIKNTVKEGFLHRTFLMREGKKCRKNWTQSYVRYIPGQFTSGASGILYCSKSKDEDKKAEIFEFHDPCHLEHTSDRKTSRQQVLGLRNVRDTEILLQFDVRDIAQEWLKVLVSHEGIHYEEVPVSEKEDKKSKKGGDKVKRESSVDVLNDNKGITDKLRSFIKRRPLKETLEKKGIYKEAVFGSTLAELASQDKTGTPIFVLQCIKNIEKSDENLRSDGLYRISGNAAQIQKIRYEIAQRNYAVLSKEKDVHNLSGALKLFFRELKEPLIPFANYRDFIEATDFEFRRMNQQVEKLNKAVKKLPSENFETLKVLLQHLLRVTEFESDNRMSVSNLAIVFGPCLMWPRVTTSSDLMTDVMLHNRVIEGLLSDFPKIFSSKR